MQTVPYKQALSFLQAVDADTIPIGLKDSQEAGEESAHAVARMRHLAIDNWDQVALFTQAVLAENGLSYREQEMHTGVGASTVYRMALGNAVGVRAVQQFAAFAAYGSRREETRAFWSGILSRFNPAEMNDPAANSFAVREEAATAEEIGALYAQLVDPDSKKAVTEFLRGLHASEMTSQRIPLPAEPETP